MQWMHYAAIIQSISVWMWCFFTSD